MVNVCVSYVFHKSGKNALKNWAKNKNNVGVFYVFPVFTLGKDQRFVLNKISLPIMISAETHPMWM